MKILIAIKCAYYWSKALDYASKRNDGVALQYLEKIFAYTEGSSSRMYTEAHILRGYLFNFEGEYESAVKSGELAIKCIHKSNKYSVDEKNYLTGYVASYCIPSFIELSRSDEASLYDKFLDYNLIELASVGPSLKRNFPLSSHPSWGKE